MKKCSDISLHLKEKDPKTKKCCNLLPKPVWFSFFWKTQKKIFWSRHRTPKMTKNCHGRRMHWSLYSVNESGYSHLTFLINKLFPHRAIGFWMFIVFHTFSVETDEHQRSLRYTNYSVWHQQSFHCQSHLDHILAILMFGLNSNN